MNKNYYELELQKSLLFANCFKLACFCVLAMAFKKWWIVLFVILFWTSTIKKEDA